ncbi:MAG: methionyl-tRNA formyltransferase [Rhodospirillales bacterium]|jgi:methionyl-tRNA formyltransferase|nr:methionyl-tRNA formyltransferase [Rhodospirillales bacterium]
MRLIFMGSADFSVPILGALADTGHEIACVYTRPPAPRGRKLRLARSPVHALAETLGAAVRTPERLKDQAEHTAFAAFRADAAVVAAYGLILPPPILAGPRWGCLNVHASVLPRWRGAAPIQHAIIAGDAETGVTIMEMDAGLDTGAILMVERVPIEETSTAASLSERLAELGAELVVRALAERAQGTLPATPQPAQGVTYAPKIVPADGRLDWCLPGAALERRVRAFHPRPGAWFEFAGTRVRVLKAALAAGAGDAPPGTVLDDRLSVACGEGPEGASALRVIEAQRGGRVAMETPAFLRGFPIPEGTRLDRIVVGRNHLGDPPTT